MLKIIRQASNSGQSLVEVLSALAIGVIFIVSAAAAIVLILKINSENKTLQIASSLAQETLDNVRILAEADWRNVYALAPKGASVYYGVIASSTALKIVSDPATSSVENVVYSRYFTVENVNRDSCGVGDLSSSATTTCGAGWPASGVAEDPSTQKITAYASWVVGGLTKTVSVAEYLTRWRNFSFRQTDWSAGSGQEGPTTDLPTGFASAACAASAAPAGSLRLADGCSSGSLISTIYDTTIFSSASSTLNSIIWSGDYSLGTVKFHLASSNSSGGPWSYAGPDGTSASYYQPTGQNVPLKINPAYHNNYRYFRYKVFIDSTSTSSPRVDDVVVNWSP